MAAGIADNKKFLFYPVLFLCVVCPYFCTGCATSKNMRDLSHTIENLQKSQNSLQVNQANLSEQMTDLVNTIAALNEQLIASGERMSGLLQQLDDIDANFSNRMDDLSRQLSGMPQPVELKPSQIYQVAFNDYTRGKYDLATIGFRNYLDRYPEGDLAGKVQFYLGECSYGKKEWQDAFELYNTLIKKNSRHEFAPEAMLKKGMCLEKLKRKKEAVTAYQSLLDSFPNSVPASKAKEYLEKL